MQPDREVCRRLKANWVMQCRGSSPGSGTAQQKETSPGGDGLSTLRIVKVSGFIPEIAGGTADCA